MSILGKIFDINEKNLKKLRDDVVKINALEESVKKLSNEQLREKTKAWQEEFKNLSPEDSKRKLEAILPEAFAIVREAAFRTCGERSWDEQLMGAVALHRGMAAELKTGEGKTLTAVHTLYLNALTGGGAHLVTVNDYLSRVQAEGMAIIFNFLGLTVGCINQEGKSYLIDFSQKQEKKYTHYSQADGSNLIIVPRQLAYKADVTYGTNNEFGFDYLRDNLVNDLSQISQTNPRGEFGAHHFAIVDEIDSILIDEARTPLIISSQAEDASTRYSEVASLVKNLVKKTDYEVDEKHKTAVLTELGVRKLERMLKLDNLYEKDFQLVHLVEQALKANTLFVKNKDYIVKDGEVVIVDEFTGRLMPGRRYSDGLHQAIEAKEGVAVQKESKTVATVSFQNLFRMYEKLSGMSGTVLTEVEEFKKIYNLESVAIPTHESVIRKDKSDLVFKNEAGKWRAVVEEVAKRNEVGQPVLIGTTSVEKNELLGSYLKRKGIKHQVLNAKHHEKEGSIIAEAGRIGAVTVATNMAGRGVDIILGGTKPIDSEKLKDWKKDHQKVLELGGLYVIGTERHESRRIDNQLRGRAGRHGEPGESRFFISLQDELMRVFGGGAIERIMGRLGLDDNTPIEAGMVSKSIEQAQKRVEGYNFDLRKHLVEYDDVMDQQRKLIYSLRRRFLEISHFRSHISTSKIQDQNQKETSHNLLWLKDKLVNAGLSADVWKERVLQVGEQVFGFVLRQLALPVIDTLWMEHLTTMDDLREGVGLQAYGQKDPLVEYRQEGRLLFEKLIGEIWATVAERVEKAQIGASLSIPRFASELSDSRSQISEKSKSNSESDLAIGDLQFEHKESELGVRDEADSIKAEANSQHATAKSFLPRLVESRSGSKNLPKPTTITNPEKVGRNDPCPCGSGKKYKKCHGR